MLKISDAALARIRQVFEDEGRLGQGLRVHAAAGGCSGLRYGLSFVEDGGQPDDVIFETGGLRVHMDPIAAGLLENGTLDHVETPHGAGFHISVPRPRKPRPVGPQADAVQRILDELINPGLASHGGYVELVDVRDNIVYLEMGGGCHGCGQADTTIKQGIEVVIRERMPEIVSVRDVTDHGTGRGSHP